MSQANILVSCSLLTATAGSPTRAASSIAREGKSGVIAAPACVRTGPRRDTMVSFLNVHAGGLGACEPALRSTAARQAIASPRGITNHVDTSKRNHIGDQRRLAVRPGCHRGASNAHATGNHRRSASGGQSTAASDTRNFVGLQECMAHMQGYIKRVHLLGRATAADTQAPPAGLSRIAI